MSIEELEKSIGWERPCIIESKETTESILFQRLKRRLAWEQKAREHETAMVKKWKTHSMELWFNNHPSPTQNKWLKIVEDIEKIDNGGKDE